jgi:hypothetical protein
MVVITGCLIALPALAQEVTQHTMDSLRDAIKAEKRAIIAVNMQLTEAEDAKFWPVYDSYQKDIEKIHQKIGDLISDYSNNYQALSDQKADELLKKSLSLEKETLHLKSHIFPGSARFFGKKLHGIISSK